MRPNLLVRSTATLAAAAAITFAAPALGNAEPQPLAPSVVPAAGAADAIGYSVQVDGHSVTYTATNVPISGYVLGFPVPGECTTSLIDAVKAAPLLGPILDGGSMPVQEVITAVDQLLDSGAVVATDLLRIANGANVVTYTFTNIPNGVYVAVTLCNVLTQPDFGAKVAVVPGLSFPGSSDGGPSNGSS